MVRIVGFESRAAFRRLSIWQNPNRLYGCEMQRSGRAAGPPWLSPERRETLNKGKLNKAITDSGLKTQYIAGVMGITPRALYDKINGVTEFKNTEIGTLSALLKLSQDELIDIFFAESVK